MEPTKDQFEQHVRGLYEGLELPAPSTTKDGVFNALDQKSSTFYSEAAIHEAMDWITLVAASLVAVGCWFMSSEGQPEQPIHEQLIIVDDISEYTDEETAIETVSVVVEEVAEEVATEIVEETTTDKSIIVELSAEDVVEEVDAPIDNMEVADKPVEVVAEDPQIEEIKEVEAPIEVKTTESDEKEQEEKEGVEWVLPASIKVEK